MNYDWLQEVKMAEILARLEIACTMEDQMEGVVESGTRLLEVLVDDVETVIEYDWLEDGELAEIVARLKIACIVEDQMEGMVESVTMETKMMADEVMDLGYDWLEEEGLSDQCMHNEQQFVGHGRVGHRGDGHDGQ